MVAGQSHPGSAQAPLFGGASGERLTTFDGSASYMERYRPSRSRKKTMRRASTFSGRRSFSPLVGRTAR